MSIGYLREISGDSGYEISGKRYDYFAPLPEVEQSIVSILSEWQIQRTCNKTMDHDDYGEYFVSNTTDTYEIASLNTLSEVAYSRTVSGDVLVEGDKPVAVIIYTGYDSDRIGSAPIDPLGINTEPTGFRDGKREFTFFYFNGEVIGNNEKIFASWEDRGIYYFTDTFKLIKKTNV